MLRKIAWRWLGACVAGGMIAGCGHSGADRPFPPDPLLQSKHPVEGKLNAPAPAPAQAVLTAPSPPAVPETAIVSAEPKSDVSRPVAATPVSHQSAPTAEKAPAPALYDHAPDYTWLQGFLERRSNGSVYLRFCDVGTEDRWGGKVCLEPDSRLNSFHDGQRIHVEGEMLPETDDTPRTIWNPNPVYRIRSARSVGDSSH